MATGACNGLASRGGPVDIQPGEPASGLLGGIRGRHLPDGRTDDGGLTWKQLGSYPTDYAHSVLAHLSEAETVYAGSEPAALFRSSNGGDSWEECPGFRAVPESSQWYFHSETRDSHVRDLRVSPNDSNYLYAGIEVGGMVRSRDGGVSWQQLPGIDDDIHCVNLSGDRPKSVYVATANGPFRTHDEGDGWELINAGLDRRYTLHIAAAPDDADLVLVTVSTNARRQNPQFYRSTDGAAIGSWSRRSGRAKAQKTWWWPLSGTCKLRAAFTPALTAASCFAAGTGERPGISCR